MQPKEIRTCFNIFKTQVDKKKSIFAANVHILKFQLQTTNIASQVSESEDNFSQNRTWMDDRVRSDSLH